MPAANLLRSVCRRFCRSELALIFLVFFLIWFVHQRFFGSPRIDYGYKDIRKNRDDFEVSNRKKDSNSIDTDNINDLQQNLASSEFVPERNPENGWYDIGYRHLSRFQDNSWSFWYHNTIVYSIQGRRPSMEDRFGALFLNQKISNQDSDSVVQLFGIFDGHGGSYVADAAEKQLLQNLAFKFKKEPGQSLNVSKTIIQETIALDGQLSQLVEPDLRLTGSTAIFGIIHEKRLYVANLGDCRAVASQKDTQTALQLTIDHKPNNKDELHTIKAAGGSVIWNGVWRVGGILAVSRALGDLHLKQPGWINARPDVFTSDLTDQPFDFVLLASDGLWDVMTNQEAIDIVRPFADSVADQSARSLLIGAKLLVDTAYKRGSTDNITVMIVKL